jgi:hypothetical protein
MFNGLCRAAELLLLELFRLQLLQFSILVPRCIWAAVYFTYLKGWNVDSTYVLEKSKFVCLTPSASGHGCMELTSEKAIATMHSCKIQSR